MIRFIWDYVRGIFTVPYSIFEGVVDGEGYAKWMIEKCNFSTEGSLVVDMVENPESRFNIAESVAWKYISFYDHNPNVFLRARLLPVPSRSYLGNRDDPFIWVRDLIRMFYGWYVSFITFGEFVRRSGRGSGGQIELRDMQRLHEDVAYHIQNLYRGVRKLEENQKRYMIAGDLYFVEMLLNYVWPYLATFTHRSSRVWYTVIARIVTMFMLATLDGSFLGFWFLNHLYRTESHSTSDSTDYRINMLPNIFETISILLSLIPIFLMLIIILYPLILLYTFKVFKNSELLWGMKVNMILPIALFVLSFLIIGGVVGIFRSFRSHPIQIIRYYYGILSGWGEKVLRPIVYLALPGIAMPFFTGRLRWEFLIIVIIFFVLLYLLMYAASNIVKLYVFTRNNITIVLIIVFLVVLVGSSVVKYLTPYVSNFEYYFNKCMFSIQGVLLELIHSFAHFVGFSLSFSLSDMYNSWPSHIPDHGIYEYVPVGSLSNLHNNSNLQDAAKIIYYPFSIYIKIKSPYDIHFISFVIFMKVYIAIVLWSLFLALKRKFMRL